MPSVLAALGEWLPASWISAGAAIYGAHGSVAILHAVLTCVYLGIAVRLAMLLVGKREIRFRGIVLVLCVLLLAGAAAHGFAIVSPVVPGLTSSEPFTFVAWLVTLAGAVMLWSLLPEAVSHPSASSLSREMEVRRAAEARARLSEAQMADLFHHLPDALFVVRLCPDGSFVFENVNTAFRHLVGEPEKDMVGTKAATFLAPPTAATLERQFAEALGTRRVTEHEAAVATGEGHRIWHTLLVPIRSAGSDIRLLGSIRDVTATRRLRSDLQEASRLATVGSMCAGVAHEMSQPINIVALWSGRLRASLAREAPDVTRMRRALEVVEEQTKRLSTLLERMRDLTDESKDTGDEVFDASEAALGAVEVVARQVALKGVSVLMAAHRESIPLRGHRAQLEQAILALVANAADAVARRLQDEPNAPARVRVTLHADHAAGEALIEVRDTGGGVPIGLQHRIFDPFFTTKEPGQGTGLGLAIAQGAARAMGGSLTTFNVGQGTNETGAVFRLNVPLATARPQTVRKIA